MGSWWLLVAALDCVAVVERKAGSDLIGKMAAEYLERFDVGRHHDVSEAVSWPCPDFQKDWAGATDEERSVVRKLPDGMDPKDCRGELGGGLGWEYVVLVEGEGPLVEPAGVDDEERSEFLGEETREYV
jgi:hypothetical protein